MAKFVTYTFLGGALTLSYCKLGIHVLSAILALAYLYALVGHAVEDWDK